MTEQLPWWKRLWLGWGIIAGRFGFAQTLVILTLFYTLLIGPFATGARAARRDLLAKRGLGGTGSAWAEADTAAPDLERSRHQF